MTSLSIINANAILNIASGKNGGTFFEIFASTITTALDPMFVPITFQTDRDKRVAALKVPGLGEFRAEPIKNPVTGEEHRARIQLPNGFEYKEAEVGNCVMNKATIAVMISRNAQGLRPAPTANRRAAPRSNRSASGYAIEVSFTDSGTSCWYACGEIRITHETTPMPSDSINASTKLERSRLGSRAWINNRMPATMKTYTAR